MSKPDDAAIPVSGESLRTLFPGYYALSDQQRMEAFERGFVSLDANALLDMYRFTPAARDEFIAVLSTMKSRLFITHQAAREFVRNRLKVYDERIEGTIKDSDDITDSLKLVDSKIRGFARRYQIAESDRDNLLSEVAQLIENVKQSLREAAEYDLRREDVRLGVDDVLREFDKLFEGRIGSKMAESDYRTAIEVASQRRKQKVPPGYMDTKDGDAERQAGDYLVWRQLMDEAKVHQRPVLLICNEDKEDWILKHRGESIGPRPELVLELQQEAGVDLYLVNVPSFLFNARKYLGTVVSDSTLAEAESLPTEVQVAVRIASSAAQQFAELSSEGQAAIKSIAREIKECVLNDTAMPSHVQRSLRKQGEDSTAEYYVARFSKTGRARLSIQHEDGVGGASGCKILVCRIYNYKGIKKTHQPPTLKQVH
jgi:hypothetical protein